MLTGFFFVLNSVRESCQEIVDFFLCHFQFNIIASDFRYCDPNSLDDTS